MAIKVYPGVKRPTHQISLSDGVRTFGLRMEDGPRSIQEIPQTPSTVHFSGGGTKFGDWEPGMSHIEQRTWEGGRGGVDFVDDPTRFFDSQMAWTLTPGKCFPVPKWKHANGHRTVVENLPGDMDWYALYSSGYIMSSQQFTHTTDWAGMDKLRIWVKRVGGPGQLKAEIWSDNAGDPDMMLVSDKINNPNVAENEIALVEFDVSNASPLSGTGSHIVLIGAASNDAANHWEIGVDADGATAKIWNSPNWDPAGFSLYYRITDANIKRKWHCFEFRGALYGIDQREDGTASSLYLNGDRGKATSSSSSAIRDTAKSWTSDQWISGYVKLTAGKGAGQSRLISGVNASTQALNITPDWEITPDTTTEYVIYHTDEWQDISPIAGDQIDGVVKDVCVLDDLVCFAQGQSVSILKMRWNPAANPPVHEFDDDGTNKADLLIQTFDATNGVQIYAANTGAVTVARAAPAAWLTDLTYGTTFDVGDSHQPINSLYLHGGKLYAFKPDGRYLINPADTAEKALGEIGFIKNRNNGEAVLSYGLYVFFSWGGYSLQRLYDQSGSYDLSNIGPDKAEGLPDSRKGPIVALQGSPSGIVAAIDGGDDNYSSVLVLPTGSHGWHEVFRGSATGKRIRNIYFQDSYRPRLWLDYDGDLVYQDWPHHTFNPLEDKGMTYQEQAILISSTIDMGVSRLPKFIKELAATVENLANGIEVGLDYQVNEDVGTTKWIHAGAYQIKPVDSLPIRRGEVYKIRYRLRLTTTDESTPPVVLATVLEGFARTPIKYQWNMRIRISSTQRDMSGVAKDADPDELLTWLKEAAVQSRSIFMRSIWEQMDSKYVVVEPPTLLREFTNNILGYWGGWVTITLREL